MVNAGDFMMMGNIVTVTVDRPLGSYHPKHKDLYYPINLTHGGIEIQVLHRFKNAAG